MNRPLNPSIALVGGAGLIGHNLALALRSMGWRVTVIDSLMVNNLFVVENDMHRRMLDERLHLLDTAGVRLVVLDARDYHVLSRALAMINPDAIMHLAAVAHIDRSNKDPSSTFDHSLRTLENALDAARQLHVKHFVYLSSSTVYGHFPEAEVDEETPCKPFGIYGALKLAGEHIVRAYNQVFDLPATIVRPCALYGARCVSGRVVQAFIENAMAGKDIVINGDGEDTVDFTYIDDLISGLCLVLEKRDAAIGETFNLTSGNARSLNDLAGIVKSHFPDTNIIVGEPDPEKPRRGTMQIAKASELLGYEPTHTLESGVAEYVKWYLQFNQQQ